MINIERENCFCDGLLLTVHKKVCDVNEALSGLAQKEVQQRAAELNQQIQCKYVLLQKQYTVSWLFIVWVEFLVLAFGVEWYKLGDFLHNILSGITQWRFRGPQGPHYSKVEVYTVYKVLFSLNNVWLFVMTQWPVKCFL